MDTHLHRSRNYGFDFTTAFVMIVFELLRGNNRDRIRRDVQFMEVQPSCICKTRPGGERPKGYSISLTLPILLDKIPRDIETLGLQVEFFFSFFLFLPYRNRIVPNLVRSGCSYAHPASLFTGPTKHPLYNYKTLRGFRVLDCLFLVLAHINLARL
jgi:hypothetical protein